MHTGSMRRTCSRADSPVSTSEFLSGVTASVDSTYFLTLIDLRLILSKNTPGGIGAIAEPMFASLSASSLLDLAI